MEYDVRIAVDIYQQVVLHDPGHIRFSQVSLDIYCSDTARTEVHDHRPAIIGPEIAKICRCRMKKSPVGPVTEDRP